MSCVNNLLRWTGCSIPDAIRTVTTTPAAMLGISVKGNLSPGADADLVVLESGHDADGFTALSITEVWKFGTQVYNANR